MVIVVVTSPIAVRAAPVFLVVQLVFRSVVVPRVPTGATVLGRVHAYGKVDVSDSKVAESAPVCFGVSFCERA